MHAHKLGKKPAPKVGLKFGFLDYANLGALPKPPTSFGHEKLVASDGWSMLGNDQYGDCVFAGAAHETMLWCMMGSGKCPPFNNASVLSDYSAVTGFNPNDPNTDQGTDMGQAASYRRKTGIVDSASHRHKVGAYLGIDVRDPHQLYAAVYLFGAIGIGIEFPGSAMDQFNKGHEWTIQRGAQIEGGHYIPFVAKHGRTLTVVTWGRTQTMSQGFLERYCDEGVVYVSEEALTNGKSPEGFDYAALIADLGKLKKA